MSYAHIPGARLLQAARARVRTWAFVAVSLSAALATAPAEAQFWDPRALEGDPTTATSPLAPRLTGLGPLTHPIRTTRNEDSQAFFTQGMNLVYAFNHPEAVRAFREAVRLDRKNAMAWWGQALALGPNLNLPMQPEAVAPAWQAIQQAVALKDRGSPVEQALIDALAARYSNNPDADRAALDRAWADAIGRVATAFPEHVDAQVLYADALMNLSPWNYWTPDGQPGEHTNRIVGLLENVMERSPDHPGALHLYIHLMEARDPARAEQAADRLARLTPGAGHLVHMPSHIYMWTGRYADAYELNARAIQADESYIAQCRAQGIYPLLYYPHNIHFMVWAAMFEGRSNVALNDARKIAAHNHLDPSFFGLEELFEQQPLYVLARFGRWDEILMEPQPPEEERLMRGLWHYARGLAWHHKGNRVGATAELASLRQIAADPALEEQYTAFAPTLTLLAIAEHVLAGEIAAGEKRYDEAIAHLERAVRLEDGLAYNEPPEWYFPVRHYLGAVLLEAGRPKEAETVYWQDLARQRENGFALFGLAGALKTQGREDEAKAVEARFAKAWSRADVQLTSSRY